MDTNTCSVQHYGFQYLRNIMMNALKILECALNDLDRIKREGEPKLPPITLEEPKIYP